MHFRVIPSRAEKWISFLQHWAIKHSLGNLDISLDAEADNQEIGVLLIELGVIQGRSSLSPQRVNPSSANSERQNNLRYIRLRNISCKIWRDTSVLDKYLVRDSPLCLIHADRFDCDSEAVGEPRTRSVRSHLI